MSSPTKRQLSYGSSLLSRSSESIDFDEAEENLAKSKNKVQKVEEIDFWDKEENEIIDYSHIKSKYFADFTKELSQALEIKLPDDSIQSLVKSLQSSIQNFISCTILDLKRTIDDCYNAINHFELHGQTSSKLCLGNYIFTLNITDKDLNPGSKAEISLNLASFYPSASTSTSNNVPFSDNLLNQMVEAYKETLEYSNCKEIRQATYYKNFNYLSDLENFTLRKTSLETFNMKKEIEWDRQELKYLKGQAKAKVQELKNKEKEIKDVDSKLRTERIRLAKESQSLEKQFQDVDDRRSKYQKLQDSLKEVLSTRPRASEANLNSSFMSSSSITSIASMDFTENLDDEQQILEKELEELKQIHSACSPDELESITMKIQKIQVRLTSIKSEKLISFSQRRSIKMNSVISKMQKSLSIKQAPLPRMPLSTSQKSMIPPAPFAPSMSGRRTTITPIPFQLSSHHVRSPTYTPPIPLTPSSNRSNNTTPINERIELHSHKKSEGFFTSDFRSSLETEEKDENQDQKLRSLVVKEARLKQKEEELVKKENFIKANLDKKVTDRDVLETLRTERMAMNRRTKEYEAKERKLEEMFAEAEKMDGQVRTRVRSLEKAQGELESDRSKLEQERDEFYSKMEEMQRLVLENL